MFDNRHRFILESPNRRMVLDHDPLGWDETETEIGRSEKTYGIFLTISNNLEFTGEAMEFLEDAYQVLGVQADIRLTKHTKHPKTDEWQLAFTGFLDFTTRSIENNRFKVDFVEGGLREILTSQMREKFELNRTTDINGNPISEFRSDTISLEGRDIYLLSRFSNENVTDFVLSSGKWDSGGDWRYSHRPAPLTAIANSDPENIQSPIDQIGTAGGYIEDGSSSKFYLISDRDRGKTKLKINLKFTIDSIVDDDVNPLKQPNLQVILRKYTGGEDFNNAPPDDEILLDVYPYNRIGETFDLEYIDEDFKINEGDSYALYFVSRGAYGGSFGDTGFMNIYFTNYSGSMSIEEDSHYSPTTASALTAFDVGARLTEVYTGKPTFKSSLLSTGKWKDLVMSCGFWIRNMKKQVNEDGETEERTLTINFEDFYKSIHAVEPCGYGIVTEGNKQFIALEELKYFFQPVRTIQLGRVPKIKRTTASEFIFSSISTGYTKGGNYEKPLGLDEYNIQTNFITPITKVESKYEVLGPSRADSYAAEQARRMQFEKFPDEDTPYDKDNFLFDCKLKVRSNQRTIFEPRKWQEDFVKAPTGIYSPETAFNLRLTPMYNLLRHSYWFNSATVKYPTQKIRYASSEGNSELSTQKIGDLEIKENSDVLISELSNPIFEPEWIEFTLPFTQDLLNQLQGRTKVGEEYINNYYGQVEFINDIGQKERGYLFSAKIKKEIEFKLLKCYGF
ncbi:hypothetical protein [Salinimicrobium sp. GXAS 041]|uniref:hypothetical protein n=1 Tax=Salinimicrobium sp. GXAS 041 TaxID=3400806 RepID=UPI003C75B99A